MKTVSKKIQPTFALIAMLSLLGFPGLVFGQTFSSGSTGANGELSPTSSTVVALPPDGVLNYTTVTIPAGVTVTFQRNAANTPVTLLATGDVTINGFINVNGSAGLGGVSTSSNINIGGLGGPGGFKGGNGSLAGGVNATAGQGPGGGQPNGGTGNYGAPTGFVSLIPLVGGSGGAGTSFNQLVGIGSSGGGGGGAILIASSSKIVVAGTIAANGGAGGATNNCGGNGSGGAIRLVAPMVTSSGSIQAIGGNSGCGGAGGIGKIRVESFSSSLTGSFNPAVGTGTTISTTPGPVSPASNPALVALPTLRIASVGGLAAPADPVASYAQGDVQLPQGSVNPVPVVVAATSMPTNAAVIVRLIPQSGTYSQTGNLTPTGTFQASTATAGINFPVGTVSVVQAWANMTLTGQIAGLFPLIDGEPVESVAVASPLGDGKPVLNLVTKSGREKRFDELAPAEQSRVVLAWQALAASR